MSSALYTVITENDESSWDDITGQQYHFPKRYLKHLQEGTKVIYYKGKIKTRGFQNQRLSNEPHYFGMADVAYVKPDERSSKDDYFAFIENYQPFEAPILISDNNKEFFEIIPTNQITNYWRNGVRPVTKDIFLNIVSKARIFQIIESSSTELETVYLDGEKKIRYGTYYERNGQLRIEAIKYHGLSCMACGFNFELIYGILGKEFIHVHHIKPLSTTGKVPINPRIDLVVVCPNCHSMLHRNKKKILLLEDLKIIIKNQRMAQQT